jgi:hypothetical protein
VLFQGLLAFHLIYSLCKLLGILICLVHLGQEQKRLLYEFDFSIYHGTFLLTSTEHQSFALLLFTAVPLNDDLSSLVLYGAEFGLLSLVRLEFFEFVGPLILGFLIKLALDLELSSLPHHDPLEQRLNYIFEVHLVPLLGLVQLEVKRLKHLERMDLFDNDFLLLVDQVPILTVRRVVLIQLLLILLYLLRVPERCSQLAEHKY